MPDRLWKLKIPIDAGRRKFLFAFGFAFAGIGFSYLFAEPSNATRRAFWWTQPAPFWALGAVWIIGGVVALLSSFGPSPRDKYGFVFLSIPAALWSLCWLVAGIFHTLSPAYYAPRAFVFVLVFGLITYAVDAVSGMVSAEHQHTPPPPEPTEDAS